jgi:hypothetical protein
MDYIDFGKHKALEKEIKIFNIKNFDIEEHSVVLWLFKKSKLKFEPQLTISAKF